MDISTIKQFLEIDTWLAIADALGWAGPFVGVAMTIVEAIFPPLPLALFVTLNVMMFGVVKGYLFSWVGTIIGSILVYLLLCKIGKKRFEKIKQKHPLVNQAAGWVHAKGGKAIFILLCFPFTPSIAVAILGAIADIPRKTYIKAVVFGKLVMIFILSVFGYNIQVALATPSRLIIIAIVGAVGYFVSKKVLHKYQSMHQYEVKKSA